MLREAPVARRSLAERRAIKHRFLCGAGKSGFCKVCGNALDRARQIAARAVRAVGESMAVSGPVRRAMAWSLCCSASVRILSGGLQPSRRGQMMRSLRAYATTDRINAARRSAQPCRNFKGIRYLGVRPGGRIPPDLVKSASAFGYSKRCPRSVRSPASVR